MKKKRKIVALTSILTILVFLAGYGVALLLHDHSDTNVVQYPLLAKRTQIEKPNEPRVNFTSLRSNLESYVQEVDQGQNNVSVYFEYLPSGVSIHINENNESVAASLMKVPVVMTLYQAAAQGKINLDKKVALKEEWLNDDYGTLYQKGAGYELTIREAARLTLKDSDNTAVLLLFDQLGDLINSDTSVINFLDLEYDLTGEDKRVLIGAQSYSSILKCLYLACYNTKEDSQEILEYLTQSTYNNRLTLLLPEELLVAHKIGTFSKEFQSDCGIFYVPQRNYLLCVMIRGEDPAASRTIANISQRVYKYISENVAVYPEENNQ